MNKKLIDLFNELSSFASFNNKEKEGVRLLLLEYLGYSEADFLINKDRLLNPKEEEEITKLVNQYVTNNIPPQYILGYTYFYSLKLKVNKNVLIPRFDTEILVDIVLDNINDAKSLVDIGTGSGAIALAIKKNRNDIKVFGVDISKDALNVAKDNSKELGIDVSFIENDLLECLGRFDVIVSNPPYISKNDIISDLVYQNEPHLALFSEENGLYFYRKILESSLEHLNKNGKIFFEIGYNQKDEIECLTKKILPNSNIKFYKDYGNNYRVAYIEVNNA